MRISLGLGATVVMAHSWVCAVTLPSTTSADVHRRDSTPPLTSHSSHSSRQRHPKQVVDTITSTSNVPGKAFDRFITIWLENTDYAKAVGDPNMKKLAKQGILLTNYHALTHASQGNYIAAAAGDYFGIETGDTYNIPSNVSTIVDVLEDKGVSWGAYQEDMPYTGFLSAEAVNTRNKANAYVRRHNPLVSFKSITENKARLGRCKTHTAFLEELETGLLPQWVFYTPNMTNNGHDTSVTHASHYASTFLPSLLSHPSLSNTLFLLTFDESHTYPVRNHVFALLLGTAIPPHLRGTTDASYYDHYSQLATVQANWGLRHLGRYDAAANVFAVVAGETGDVVRVHPDLGGVWLNQSYPGAFHRKYFAPIPPPNLALRVNGRGILPAIRKEWGELWRGKGTVYDGSLEIPWRYKPQVYKLPSEEELKIVEGDIEEEKEEKEKEGGKGGKEEEEEEEMATMVKESATATAAAAAVGGERTETAGVKGAAARERSAGSNGWGVGMAVVMVVVMGM
ncbi:phosphoesterase-domain-containing protein [Ascodesmis nigricans]|uniref:Phosphoesterase-domain-containing protein n=1 Tax=Ascodesmis nigricans TaxID=341454 RepID=A0A4S2MKW9_9PEZI|nr:phosphoesterase-domain-containing protein [Ascodesmis nigricans]